MKKLILISLVLLLLIFAGLGTLLPIGFHNFVHQTVMPNLTAKGVVAKFSDLGFNQKQTSFELLENKPPLRVEVNSISSFNPKNNHLKIKITDLEKKIPIEFEVHPIVTSEGNLKIHLKLMDFTYKNETVDIKTKAANIYLGDFSLEDIQGLEKDPSALYFNKFLTIDLKSLAGKINNQDKLINDLHFELGTKVIDNELSIHLNSKIGKANILKQTESIDAKDTSFTFRLGDFDYEKTKNILASLPKQFENGKKPSMFAMLGYIKAIKFPFELNYDGSSKLGSDEIKLKLNAKVKSKHILNLDTFGLNLNLQHQKEGIIDMLIPLLANRYAGDIVNNYALKPKQTSEERFLDRNRINSKLQEVLKEAINAKREELLTAALDIRLLTKQGNLFATNIILEDKVIDMNNEKFPFSQIKRIPRKLIRAIFPNFNPKSSKINDSELASLINGADLFRAVTTPIPAITK